MRGDPADFPLAETVRQMAAQMRRRPLRRVIGRLSEVGPGGLSTTLGDVAIGEICRLRDPHSGQETISQVVAIRNGRAILAPIGTTDGLSVRTDVIPEYGPFTFWCGMEMLGGVYDGLGNRIDGVTMARKGMIQRDIVPRAPSPLDRPLIDDVMPTGISAVDSMLTCGIGQRVALLGPPGAGKSTFIGALARNAQADICVLALIGERGRELREFLDRQLPPEFRERCIVVASTSDRPAMERVIGAHIATSIAEYFRERGHHVLLLFDSVTRFARALREVGLASGEQPVRRGFTPSVYAELPRLIERCGKDPNGAITALYTVLLENDGMNDPIAEEIVSLTDGHLVLAGKLAQAGHHPALDILRSTSRVMNEIVEERHLAAARKLRALMARYEEVELLVQVGEYAQGRDALADEAIAKRDRIQAFLRQSTMKNRPFAETVAELERLAG